LREAGAGDFDVRGGDDCAGGIFDRAGQGVGAEFRGGEKADEEQEEKRECAAWVQRKGFRKGNGQAGVAVHSTGSWRRVHRFIFWGHWQIAQYVGCVWRVIGWTMGGTGWG